MPWDGCLQHEPDSAENGLTAHDELARIAFGGRCEDRGRAAVEPQFFASGSSSREGLKRKCFRRYSGLVVLAALSSRRAKALATA